MHVVFFGRIPHPDLNTIWAAVRNNLLVSVNIGGNEPHFMHDMERLLPKHEFVANQPAVAPFLDQITAYLNAERQQFDLAIDWQLLKPFQSKALRKVYEIPYGTTLSYGEIAQQLDQPGAARAVGHANATNPMPIVIPCHRVLGSDGKLHGYSGGNGLETKAWLLQLEGVAIAQQLKLF